jgi:hypothetical protein
VDVPGRLPVFGLNGPVDEDIAAAGIGGPWMPGNRAAVESGLKKYRTQTGCKRPDGYTVYLQGLYCT